MAEAEPEARGTKGGGKERRMRHQKKDFSSPLRRKESEGGNNI